MHLQIAKNSHNLYISHFYKHVKLAYITQVKLAYMD